MDHYFSDFVVVCFGFYRPYFHPGFASHARAAFRASNLIDENWTIGRHRQLRFAPFSLAPFQIHQIYVRAGGRRAREGLHHQTIPIKQRG